MTAAAQDTSVFQESPEMSKSEPIICLQNLCKTYATTAAVDNVELDIHRGEFFTLLGPSGSGKTTTLRMIGGFETPDQGQVWLNGGNITYLPPFKRNINTVFQDYALFPHMTVSKNLAYGLEAKRLPKREIDQRVTETLQMVQLEHVAKNSPNELSGGQRQRIALARAVINQPQVLLLDEPLGALDLKLRQQMQLELQRIQKEVQITFIYVTHDQDEALIMSDRIAIFNQGRIEQMGKPIELYEQPANDFVANFLGASNLIDHNGKCVLLRPEKIHLLSSEELVEDSNWEIASAEILETTFLGAFTRYLVRLKDNTELLVLAQNLESLTHLGQYDRGSCVRVAWRHDSLYEIPH